MTLQLAMFQLWKSWEKLQNQRSEKNLSYKFFTVTLVFIIGTKNEHGAPVSRESEEYFQDKKLANEALQSGEWTQRPDILS